MTESPGKLAFIGTGNMGMAMAQRWSALGGSVLGCDIDLQRQQQLSALGAAVYPDPASLARALPAGGMLILAVVDAQQCHQVLLGAAGAAAHLPRDSCVMLCSTIAPSDTERLAQGLSTCGVDCIDAPMSGGPQRAAAGTMSLMVACSDASWSTHGQTLQRLADPVLRVGTRVGDGARTKLVNNLLAGINLVGAAEALALAERLGLDLARTLEVIGHSSGASWVGQDRMRRAIAKDWQPRAHMTLLAKDTALALAAARQVGFDGPLGSATAAQFQSALLEWANADDAAMLQHLRQTCLGPTAAKAKSDRDCG